MLDMLHALVPVERLLMGFDFPLMPVQSIAPSIQGFDAYQKFDEGEKQKIRFGNAAGLFPRFGQAGA